MSDAKTPKSPRTALQKLVLFLATGFGAGYSPIAPGTCGTFVALPIYFAFEYGLRSPVFYMAATVLLSVAAVFIAERAEQLFGDHDNQKIVIDEIAGFLVTMAWLPRTWQAVVGGFVLFRILDAWKPWPIRVLDRRVKGGLGVVVDDLAAGIIANFILQVIYTHTTWLGLRLLE
jgi:phosphatidylglycerophosphatase A